MGYGFPFTWFPYADLFESYLPDFVLAFTFFTAVVFAVLERRFGNKRPAVAMSAALGLALTVGLVWWEVETGRSIRDLGPLAAGFALILLAGVLYQSIKHVGGGWAGAAIAFGASILVGWLVGIDWPIDVRALQTVVTVVLVFGVIAFLLHRHGAHAFRSLGFPGLNEARQDVGDLYEDHRVADRLTRGFRRLRKDAGTLLERPEGADDVMLQLRRMLPAEGWLTERMARLRARAHQVRKGHVARIEEIQHVIGKLPSQEKRKLSIELQRRYKELKLDVRIERLDKAVTENERRIRELTQRAGSCLQANDHRALVDLLAQAEKLQRHNAKLIQTIERTETRLIRTAKAIASQPGKVNSA
jgi:hypothetical protein